MIFLLLFVCIEALEASQITGHFTEVANSAKTEKRTDSSIFRELIQRVEILEARDRSQAQEIDDLNQDIASQKNEMAALHQKNDKLDRLIYRLMQRLSLRGGNSAASPNGNDTDAGMMTFERKGNRIRRYQNEVTVAFTAGLAHRLLHMGSHQNIVFDHVETNIGNGYNPDHGVFTAPVAGVYVFHTTILTDSDREVWCRLVVNGILKEYVYAR